MKNAVFILAFLLTAFLAVAQQYGEDFYYEHEAIGNYSFLVERSAFESKDAWIESNKRYFTNLYDRDMTQAEKRILNEILSDSVPAKLDYLTVWLMPNDQPKEMYAMCIYITKVDYDTRKYEYYYCFGDLK